MGDVLTPEGFLMRRFLSTRHGFFALAALICWSLVLVIDPKFRWVALGLGGLYFVLSMLFWAEDLGRTNGTQKPRSRG